MASITPGISARRTSLSVPNFIDIGSANSLLASDGTRRRGRSSSLIALQEITTNDSEYLDQNAFRNVNPEWVNSKGAWLIHPILILLGKVMVDSIPGMTQSVSWTIVNLGYMIISYLMFHYVTGIPFGSEDHAGAYDDLTLWEQMDEGAHNTPAKKWLLFMPIALFLISTHYSHYSPWAFAINFTALLFVVIAKLPQMHRQRVVFLPPDTPGISAPMTPLASNANSQPPSGRTTPTPSFSSSRQ